MSAPRDLEELRRRFRTGLRPKFVFFWSHQPSGKRDVGSGHPECLSQWYPAPFELEGKRYPTAEHYMMAAKARLFGDSEAEDAVLRAPHPAAAKKIGRGVRGFDESRWADERSALVVAGNTAKFTQNLALRAYLIGTKERILAEASPTDRIWGIGLAVDDEHASNPLLWRGLNLLGFALMEVRSRIR